MMTKVGKPVYKGPWLRIAIHGMECWNGRAWAIMDREAAWAFMAMMRGPDNSNSELKDLTTSRVRGLFCDYSQRPDDMQQPPWMDFPMVHIPSTLSAKQRAHLAYLIGNAPDHFSRHWNLAQRTVVHLFGRWPYPAPKKAKSTKHK